MAHVLVVGGSKALAEVALFLAEHDNTVTIVSNHEQHLRELAQKTTGRAIRINPLQLDVHNDELLYSSLVQSMDEHGPIVLAVNWLSPGGEATIEMIARLANSKSPLCRFFQVIRSGGAALTESLRISRNSFVNLPKVLYRTISVGMDNHGENLYRPLSPRQICAGVIDAIRNDRRDHHIGWTGALGAYVLSALSFSAMSIIHPSVPGAFCIACCDRKKSVLHPVEPRLAIR